MLMRHKLLNSPQFRQWVRSQKLGISSLETKRASIKMPELILFVKVLLVGFLLAEVARLAYIGGSGLSDLMRQVNSALLALAVVVVLILLAVYALLRGVIRNAVLLKRSQRIDLLFLLLLGIFANHLVSPSIQEFHREVSEANPQWALMIAVFFIIIIVSTLARYFMALRRGNPHQMYFIADEEIESETDDLLSNAEQAESFAQTVLASGSDSGLVYGLDGPWGIGKTSFINLVSNYWKDNAAEEVIYFRFEPLRYASESDLALRLIRELSATIQRQIYVPEFRPVANRYTRLLKGKTDFSFLGFKFSIAPAEESIDELLEDIDDVLKRIRRRLVVIVDDLDRLEPKGINNVLFTVRRTFKLTQATYILCYDTESLLAKNDDNERARRFLEKFVNIKLSLFIDSTDLVKFLRIDWSKGQSRYQSIPSETMLKLASILSELANILEGEHAAEYMLLIGDMRKLKRFVNAILLMHIEKTDLARTDFNRKDLVNLMLLHLNYPGIFRQIYVEETEGRSGMFSIKVTFDSSDPEYENAKGFNEYTKQFNGPDKFLLNQLFEKKSLEIGAYRSVDEIVRTSRACFNDEPHRNLEKFLKLIVRFTKPEPRETFILYQDAVNKVVRGEKVDNVLSEPEFSLDHGENAHDQFWRILVSQSHEFSGIAAEDSIDTLVEYLPSYSSVDIDDRGLRRRSIYNLIRLLDRAGWGGSKGKSKGRNLPNTSENVVEIAYRIYGENEYKGHGLIDRLAEQSRGVLGLSDLVLFRLQCSADRQGQVYNLQRALIVHDDMDAKTDGPVNALAIEGMRTISQRVFAVFKSSYIDAKRNFYDEVDAISEAELFGSPANEIMIDEPKRREALVKATRSAIKSFVIYQLINRQPGTGSGVGCGYYDQIGTADGGEIESLVNDYLFEVCFNPAIKEQNIKCFLDYCLTKFTSGMWSGDDEDKYHLTPQGLTTEIDVARLIEYWVKYGKDIKKGDFVSSSKQVFTLNYTATYREDLPSVFDVLDQIKAEYDPETQDQANTEELKG